MSFGAPIPPHAFQKIITASVQSIPSWVPEEQHDELLAKLVPPRKPTQEHAAMYALTLPEAIGFAVRHNTLPDVTLGAGNTELYDSFLAAGYSPTEAEYWAKKNTQRSA